MKTYNLDKDNIDKNLYEEFYRYCNNSEDLKVKKFLKANPDFDLLSKDEWDGESIFFDLTFKRDSVEILNMLLKHYERTKLSKDPESLEHKVARSKLLDILFENQSIASDKLQELIKPYITDACEQSDNDLDWDEMSNGKELNDSGEFILNPSSDNSDEYSPLTSENLIKFSQQFQDNDLQDHYLTELTGNIKVIT